MASEQFYNIKNIKMKKQEIKNKKNLARTTADGTYKTLKKR